MPARSAVNVSTAKKVVPSMRRGTKATSRMFTCKITLRFIHNRHLYMELFCSCVTCNKEFKENSFLQRHYTTKYHRKRENMLVEGPKEDFHSDGDPEEMPGYMEEGQVEMEESQAEIDVLLEDIVEDQYENHEELVDEQPFEDFDYDDTIMEEELYT